MYLWVCVNIQLCFFTPPLTLKTLTNPLNQHFPITTLQCLFSNSFSFFTPPRLWSQGSWSPSARWLRPWIEVVQVKPAPASVACVLCTSVVCPQVTPPTPSVCSHVQYVCLRRERQLNIRPSIFWCGVWWWSYGVEEVDSSHHRHWLFLLNLYLI